MLLSELDVAREPSNPRGNISLTCITSRQQTRNLKIIATGASVAGEDIPEHKSVKTWKVSQLPSTWFISAECNNRLLLDEQMGLMGFILEISLDMVTTTRLQCNHHAILSHGMSDQQFEA